MRVLQDDTVIIETSECKTAAQCQGTVGIVMNVIVGIKMVVLVLLNVQGYLWWRKARRSNFTAALKLLMIGSTAIVRTLLTVLDNLRVRLQVYRKELAAAICAVSDCRLVCVLHPLRAGWRKTRHQGGPP